MRLEQLSQRQLAGKLGLSQGHLSKLISGKFRADARALATLREWATGPAASIEEEFVATARVALRGEPDGMMLLMHLMQFLARRGETSSARRDSRARTRQSRPPRV